MEQVEAIVGREKRDPGRSAAAVSRAAFAGLVIGGLATTCAAADSMSGLGAAFRPQGKVAAPAAGSGGRSDANLPGLRVIVTRPSRPVASIDGQIVHVGDIVNGMRVAQINAQGVVLVGEGGAEERMVINPVVKRMRPASDATRASNGARQ